MTRGEIYRTRERVAERGGKPGFYVVVSRAFIADNDERFTYTFHLDDPAVNYFTHREILKLAMRSV